MTTQELREHAQTMNSNDRSVMLEALDLIDSHNQTDKANGKAKQKNREELLAPLLEKGLLSPSEFEEMARG